MKAKPLFTLLSLSLISSLWAETKHLQSYPLQGNESADQLLEIASNILPHPRQIAYHQEEFIAFIHFGPNTFTGKEWGNGMEDPKAFAPISVDTDNWCSTLKKAGMKKVILTVKHHDGYCTWQTRYNDAFSVHASPWKNGHGDVLKQLSKSAKKYGLKLGIYLSPADLYQIEHKDGLYGNGSQAVDSVIPTEPASLRSNPQQQRATDGPVFHAKVDDYNRYFMNQLYELLTEYGAVDEVWFDGAHPKQKGGQQYNKKAWFEMIRKLAPNAVIFGGPDIRWCGNEHGGTRADEWNVIHMHDLDNHSGLDRTPASLGNDTELQKAEFTSQGKNWSSNVLNYTVSEVDTSIRNGWFWRNDNEQAVKSADWAFDVYERAVGGNAVFLLNVPPNKSGVLSKRDTAVLIETGRRIRTTYGTDLAAGMSSNAEGIHDNNLDTYWQPSAQAGEFSITLPQPQTINRIALQESITKVGQRVKTHAIDAWIDGAWKEISTAGTIGYKRIHRFADITTDQLRVRILDSRGTPSIAEISAHYYAAPPQIVSIHANAGKVELRTKDNNQAIHYTLDGSEPTADSPRYSAALDLPDGGMLRARSIAGQQLGEITTTRIGISNEGWKATASSEHPNEKAAFAIDGDPHTHWHSFWGTNEPKHPHTLTIELPEPRDIAGFTYLPRQDTRTAAGMIENWKVSISQDGKHWKKIDKGAFGNILNDPSQRTHIFDKKHTCRFFRLTSLSSPQGEKFAGAAEIGLLSPAATRLEEKEEN